MSSSKTFSRRAFLGRAAKLTLGGSGLYASLGSMNLMRALAADNAIDYRALVCIFLAGGNDSFNMLVPRSDGEYATYLDSRRNMAIAQEDILPLEIPGSGNALYGVHPSMPEVQQLFNSGALAMVSNVGALLEPVNKSAVLAEQANLPGQLFSHNNQIAFWQKLQSDNSNPTGWAGRMADLLLANSGNALSSPIPPAAPP